MYMATGRPAISREGDLRATLYSALKMIVDQGYFSMIEGGGYNLTMLGECILVCTCGH